MQFVTYNFAAAKHRRVTYQGREYLVAPMTLLVPGVLTGSDGPLLYPPDEVANNAPAWNGMPIVINHPYHTARNQSVLDTTGIGVLFNTRFEGGRLKGEGWFDIAKTRHVDAKLLTAIQSGEQVEVSTGLQVQRELMQGVHNGQEYIAIARNYRPDHLAILPNTRGACSVHDGCGVNSP